MTDLIRPFRVVLVALALGVAAPSSAADLPHHRRGVRPLRGAPPVPPTLGMKAVIPAVPLVPVVIARPRFSGLVFMPVLPDSILAPRRGGCQPGFMVDAGGPCRRNGELLVACDPYGGPCHPLPSTPIPYGIGPYLRPEY